LGDRFLRFKRFRQRAVQSPTGAYWADDPKFDIAAHVLRVKLRGAAGKAELETLVSDLMATPLDPSRPMWQFHLVEGYGEGSAVVVRIHHCYADGIALIQVMLSMTDADRKGRVPGPVPPPPKRSESTDGSPDVFAGVLNRASRMGSILIEKAAGLLARSRQGSRICQQGSALTEELAKLALMGEDSRTCFKGQPGIAKRVAWADPIAVAEVKRRRPGAGLLVNDVLLSSVVGALART
jgi:WS/DGAT/MGAT family acyltransferase